MSDIVPDNNNDISPGRELVHRLNLPAIRKVLWASSVYLDKQFVAETRPDDAARQQDLSPGGEGQPETSWIGEDIETLTERMIVFSKYWQDYIENQQILDVLLVNLFYEGLARVADTETPPDHVYRDMVDSARRLQALMMPDVIGTERGWRNPGARLLSLLKVDRTLDNALHHIERANGLHYDTMQCHYAKYCFETRQVVTAGTALERDIRAKVSMFERGHALARKRMSLVPK